MEANLNQTTCRYTSEYWNIESSPRTLSRWYARQLFCSYSGVRWLSWLLIWQPCVLSPHVTPSEAKVGSSHPVSAVPELEGGLEPDSFPPTLACFDAPFSTCNLPKKEVSSLSLSLPPPHWFIWDQLKTWGYCWRSFLWTSYFKAFSSLLLHATDSRVTSSE